MRLTPYSIFLFMSFLEFSYITLVLRLSRILVRGSQSYLRSDANILPIQI